jgi:hypothetical protein
LQCSSLAVTLFELDDPIQRITVARATVRPAVESSDGRTHFPTRTRPTRQRRFDVDAGAEGSLDVLHVGGGGSTPANGVEKGIQLVGRVEAARFGQSDLLDDLGPRLDLRDDLQFFAEAVVFHRGQGEQVVRAGEGGFEGRGRERAGAHLVDDPLPGAGVAP